MNPYCSKYCFLNSTTDSGSLNILHKKPLDTLKSTAGKGTHLELLQFWHYHRHLSKQEGVFLLLDLITIVICKEPTLQVVLLWFKTQIAHTGYTENKGICFQLERFRDHIVKPKLSSQEFKLFTETVIKHLGSHQMWEISTGQNVDVIWNKHKQKYTKGGQKRD